MGVSGGLELTSAVASAFTAQSTLLLSEQALDSVTRMQESRIGPHGNSPSSGYSRRGPHDLGSSADYCPNVESFLERVIMPETSLPRVLLLRQAIFHGVRSYPYGPPDAYPSDSQHQRYLREFNTREVKGRVSPR
jgi:hypothetical protein